MSAGLKIANQGGKDRRSLACLQQPQRKGQCQRGLRSGSDLRGSTLLHERATERLTDFNRPPAVAFLIPGPPEDAGDVRQHFGILEEEGRRRHLGCGELRPPGRSQHVIIPVTQALREQTVGGPALQIGKVPGHRRVVLLQQRAVAGEEVLLPGNVNERCPPLRRRTKGAAEYGVFRRDVGHEALGCLRVGHVVDVLRRQARKVELVAKRGSVEVVLLQPAEFFAVRAVGQDGHHVRALRPAHQVPDPAQHRIRRSEMPDRARRGMHNHHVQAVDPGPRRVWSGRFGGQQLGMHVTRTDVVELGKPGLGPIGGLRILPPGAAAFRPAHRSAMNRAIRLHELAGRQAHGGSGGSRDHEPRHERGVLPKIIERRAGSEFAHAHRRPRFNRPDRLGTAAVAFERSEGRLVHDGRRCPAPGIVTRKIPPGRIPAGIVILAAIHAGKDDRSLAGPPVRTGADALHRAVGVLEPELRDDAQRSVAADKLGEPSGGSLHVIHAVAEDHPNDVLTGRDQGRHIARLIKRCVPVLGPARREHVVAGLGAVDPQLVVTQSAHMDQGPRKAGPDPERPPEERVVSRHRRTNPARLPVGFRQDAHRPLGRVAPRARLIADIPGPHLPVHGLRTLQGPSVVRLVQGLVSSNLAGIPQVRGACEQPCGGGRRTHLPRGLRLAALCTHDLPRKPRGGDVHPHRVHRGLAKRAAHTQGRSRRRRQHAEYEQ